MIRKERLLKQFIALVELDSESGEEGKIKDYLYSEFSRLGAEVYEDHAGVKTGGEAGNLLIKIPGSIDKEPILFNAHMDTVKPGKGVIAIVEEGKIKSKSDTILGADDKAAIAILLEVYIVLQEQGVAHLPLEILLSVQEEQGLKGAKAFDFNLLKAKKGFVLDAAGSPGTIVVGAPCQNQIEYTVYGKAAHAGMEPEKGLNAIQIAALALSQMPCGRIDEETTCNFGVIAGGQARNIVADYCHIGGETRSHNRQKLNKLSEELKNKFIDIVEEHGGRAEVDIEFLYPEISLDENAQTVKIASKAAKNIGLDPSLIKAGGGSDANIINGQNIECVNLGIGMCEVHTNNEYIKIADLVKNAELVLEIIRVASN